MGEHFVFTFLAFIVLLGAFTAVSLVPLLGSRPRLEEDEEES